MSLKQRLLEKATKIYLEQTDKAEQLLDRIKDKKTPIKVGKMLLLRAQAHVNIASRLNDEIRTLEKGLLNETG